MIKLSFRKVTGLVVAFLFLWITSCSKKDKDNLVKGGPATVKINFMGEAYDEETPDGKAAVRSMDIQKTTIMIDPSTYVSIEAVPDTIPKIRTLRAALNNSWLRVVVYDNNNNRAYKIHQDYYVVNGQALGDDILLDGGGSYTIVAYSSGSGDIAKLPSIDPSRSLSQSTLTYDHNLAQDLMYFKKDDFSPTGEEDNYLNILLKHKVAQLIANLKTQSKLIKRVKDVKITPNNRFGEFSLDNGIFLSTNTAVAKSDILYNDATGATNVSLPPIYVNGETGGSDGIFEATINIADKENTVKTDPFFKITRGKKKHLNIDFNITAGGCKVRIGPNTYATFACHNVGADINEDPFTPSAAIHGAKFKWGAGIDEIGNYISQADDQLYNLVLPPDNIWRRGNSANADGWSESSKGPKDPCPPGYKVPSAAIWDKVIANNTLKVEGYWGPRSYTGGMLIYDPSNPENKMLLPTGGERLGQDRDGYGKEGQLINLGNAGDYHSTTKNGSGNNLPLHIYRGGSATAQGYTTGPQGSRHGAMVRCIKY